MLICRPGGPAIGNSCEERTAGVRRAEGSSGSQHCRGQEKVGRPGRRNIEVYKTPHQLLANVYQCRLLNTAQGSLLDDEQLVNTLQSSKTTSMEVTEQLEISEQTEVKIDAAREV